MREHNLTNRIKVLASILNKGPGAFHLVLLKLLYVQCLIFSFVVVSTVTILNQTNVGRTHIDFFFFFFFFLILAPLSVSL